MIALKKCSSSISINPEQSDKILSTELTKSCFSKKSQNSFEFISNVVSNFVSVIKAFNLPIFILLYDSNSMNHLLFFLLTVTIPRFSILVLKLMPTSCTLPTLGK